MGKDTALIGGAVGIAGQIPGLLDSASGRLSVNNRRPYFDPRTGESYVVVNSGGTVRKVRVNQTALLQHEEWVDIDRAVISAAVQRMVAVADLRSRGLVHNLGSIGLTISLWDAASDMTEADVSMSAVTRGEKDTPAFRPAQVPVPIVHKDFQVELRRLEASRRFGESIDVTAAQISARRVVERTEQILFAGAPVQVDGSPLYGYTTHPDRNILSLAASWSDDSLVSGQDIVADVQAMLQAARDDRHYGPFVLYIPGPYEARLDDDYRDMDNRTIRQRILALSGIEDIRVADFLADDNIVLVQMTSDVVDLAIAQDITTVQWSTLGGMQEEFKVMAVWAPRIKSDYDGRSGIVHMRPTP